MSLFYLRLHSPFKSRPRPGSWSVPNPASAHPAAAEQKQSLAARNLLQKVDQLKASYALERRLFL
ncbi:MAG: hypothetical protein ACKO7W_12180 [Elainella sp.]